MPSGIEDATTVLRGTIRYTGFVKAVRELQFLGLLDTEDHPSLHSQGPEITWRALVCDLLGVDDKNIFYDNLKNKVVERTGSEYAVEVLEELGLLDDKKIEKCGTPMDTLTHHLANRLALGKSSSSSSLFNPLLDICLFIYFPFMSISGNL